MERSVGQVTQAGDGRGVGEAGVKHISNTRLLLVNTDHVTWILASDWLMLISSNFSEKLLGKTRSG